jgi:endothelin-converting enzyme/putative endopeptidase
MMKRSKGILLLVFLLGSRRTEAQESKSLRFDLDNMEKTADPCTDFYRYACGSWMQKNPIPPDQSRWGRFNQLADRNREILKRVLEEASKDVSGREPIDQKIGDFYASCMDEPAAEGLGSTPLKPELDEVAGLRAKPDLPGLVARLRRDGVNAFLTLVSEQDFKNPESVIARVDQGGLGLPDRDMYFKDDAASADLRAKYVDHVKATFVLAGDTPAKAAAGAKTVMDFETALAKVSMDRVARRDPANVYHMMKKEEVLALAPSFPLGPFFQAAETPAFTELNVAVPDFVKGMNALVEKTDLESLRTYVRWRVVDSKAALLSKPFVEEDFSFNGKALTGAKELRPRWKRCVDRTDVALGEALGERYVALTFGKEGKERTAKMVAALEKALGEDIVALDWMTPETKTQAEGKLGAIANKIGYPDAWRDYSTLKVERKGLVENFTRANAFEFRRTLSKIGRPLDRKEWRMTPPTVNAYYRATLNDINFPAGILQPPFYDNDMDDAVNFGGIGAVIGHELTHGFDDQGRKFGPDGSLKDWWTEADAREFEKRAQCIVDEYGSFSPVPDVKLNGKLTLGENTADNGGVRVALRALHESSPEAKGIDGFTPDQRFFLGFAQVWCENRTSESARLLAQVDPHSPGRYRVNGTVSNMPEFQKAFGCKEGQAMVRENMCHVW